MELQSALFPPCSCKFFLLQHIFMREKKKKSRSWVVPDVPQGTEATKSLNICGGVCWLKREDVSQMALRYTLQHSHLICSFMDKLKDCCATSKAMQIGLMGTSLHSIFIFSGYARCLLRKSSEVWKKKNSIMLHYCAQKIHWPDTSTATGITIFFFRTIFWWKTSSPQQMSYTEYSRLWMVPSKKIHGATAQILFRKGHCSLIKGHRFPQIQSNTGILK